MMDDNTDDDSDSAGPEYTVVSNASFNLTTDEREELNRKLAHAGHLINNGVFDNALDKVKSFLAINLAKNLSEDIYIECLIKLLRWGDRRVRKLKLFVEDRYIDTDLFDFKDDFTHLTRIPVKQYGKRIIRDYLNAPVEIEVPDPDDANETVITTVPRLSTLKFRALLQELAMHNDDGNFDRHDALVMLMLLREDKLRLYNGRPSDYEQVEEDDEFFIKNYDNKIGDKGMRLSENGIMTLNSKPPSYLTSEEAYDQIKNYMR